MENNSTLERVLLVCNRNVELLRLVEATFDSRRIRKKNLMILKSLQKKSLQFFTLFVDTWVVKYQMKVFGKL